MNLKEARFHRGLSQWEMGARIGISQSKLSLVERGYLSLTEEEKNKIAEFLDIPADLITWPGKDRRQSKHSTLIPAAIKDF